MPTHRTFAVPTCQDRHRPRQPVGHRPGAALVVAVLICASAGWKLRSSWPSLRQAGTSPPRPEVRRPPGPASGALVHLSSFSFPSGHLVGTLTLCAGVAWVLSGMGQPPRPPGNVDGSFLLTIAVGCRGSSSGALHLCVIGDSPSGVLAGRLSHSGCPTFRSAAAALRVSPSIPRRGSLPGDGELPPTAVGSSEEGALRGPAVPRWSRPGGLNGSTHRRGGVNGGCRRAHESSEAKQRIVTAAIDVIASEGFGGATAAPSPGRRVQPGPHLLLIRHIKQLYLAALGESCRRAWTSTGPRSARSLPRGPGEVGSHCG